MWKRATATPDAEPQVAQGNCYALFAYDIGFSIDLVEAERRIKAQREFLRHKRRAPRYFNYEPPPLRVTQEGDSIPLGARHSASRVEVVLFDFGAVSVTYTVPLGGPLSGLISLSEALYESELLLSDSRQRVQMLLEALRTAVVKPSIADFVESYAVFEVAAFAPASDPVTLCRHHGATLARILRSERLPLSEDEVRDATALHISYGNDDVALIDWDAAFLLGTEMEDVRAVLEFANVELLEMRHLDTRLDSALEEAYQALSRRTWRRWFPLGSRRTELRRVGEMQVDGAILFEGVNNALKLLGDQYLARLYRLVSDRFHLSEWDASILRKLETLESIYEKMSDAAANRRIEILEWIIIILIALEIVITLVPALSH